MKFLRLQPLVSLAWSVIRNVLCENRGAITFWKNANLLGFFFG